MSGTTAATTPTAVIDRISLVLDAFDGPGRLTLAQIVRRTGLPRSSAHRMLERLVQLRWLRRSGRDYELGMRLVELGSLAVHQDRLVRAAGPLLGELHRATGLVAHLAVLDGPDVKYLDKVGDRMADAIPTRVGARQPAHCTAVGKAILAYNDVQVNLRARKTKYSISTSSQLAAELAKVRAHGVAFEREESLLGFGCVAAPIGGPGEAVAAVSVCGPMSRMMFDQRLTAPVRMTAMGIWRNAEDGPRRVAPTLQPLRPLRPHTRPALQYARIRSRSYGGVAPAISSTMTSFPWRTASKIDSCSAIQTRNTPRPACADTCSASARSAQRRVASAFHCTLVWFQVLLRTSTRAAQRPHATGTIGISSSRLSILTGPPG